MKPKRPRSELPPEGEALLAHERAALPIAAEVRQRLLARAEQASLQPASAPQPQTGPRAFLRRPLWLAIAAVSGLAAVAGIVQLLEPAPAEPPLVPAVPSPSASEPAHPLGPSPESPAPPPSTSPAPAPAPEPPARSAASVRSADTVDELELLGRARQANSRGDFATVLGLVTEHAQRYPRGRLVEEREVLRVKALVGLGRSEQAQKAAARFRKQFPRSVLLGTIDQMVPPP